MQKKCSNINKGIFWTLFPPIYFCGYSNIRKVSSRNLSNVWRFSRLTIYCKSSILKMRMEKYLIICDKSSSTCTYEIDIDISRNNHNLTFFGFEFFNVQFWQIQFWIPSLSCNSIIKISWPSSAVVSSQKISQSPFFAVLPISNILNRCLACVWLSIFVSDTVT